VHWLEAKHDVFAALHQSAGGFVTRLEGNVLRFAKKMKLGSLFGSAGPGSGGNVGSDLMTPQRRSNPGPPVPTTETLSGPRRLQGVRSTARTPQSHQPAAFPAYIVHLTKVAFARISVVYDEKRSTSRGSYGFLPLSTHGRAHSVRDPLYAW